MKTPEKKSIGSNQWITKELPDDGITVLVRIRDVEWPLMPGWHEDGKWYDTNADEIEEGKVIGWMHLHDAANMLDSVNSKPKRERPVATRGKKG